jgi:cytochrome c oxidase cbb3-type subunit 3
MASTPKLCAVSLLCAAAFAQHQEPAASAAPDSGTALFRRHCRSCHGRGGEGGRAPSLTGRLHAGETDADMVRVVQRGIPGTEMSAYSARLGDEGIARIVSYLRSVKRDEPSLAGDAARGEALFWGKAGCSNCHAVGKRGNRLGPDLSRVGRQRSAGFLRESLLQPEADIAANYQGVTVVTADGRTIRGLERAFDEFTVVLQDFSGKAHSFDRATLKSAVRDTASLMPAYGSMLTAYELEDVLKYLSTLGTGEAGE